MHLLAIIAAGIAIGGLVGLFGGRHVEQVLGHVPANERGDRASPSQRTRCGLASLHRAALGAQQLEELGPTAEDDRRRLLW